MTRPSFSETGLRGLFSPDPWGSLAYVPALFLPQRFAAVLEALEKGQPVDLSAMPPSPEGQYQGGGGSLLRLGLGLAKHAYPYLHLCSGFPRPEAPSTGFPSPDSALRCTPGSGANAPSDGL